LETLALIVRVGAGNQVSFVPSKPILDASVLLDFAEVTQGDVNLTEIGQDFATTILRSQNLFRQQVLANVPVLVSMI
jgi:NitT/TauT family transport system ATP-binding protein